MKNIVEYINENQQDDLTDGFSKYGNFLSEVRGSFTNNYGRLRNINETNAKRMFDKHSEFGFIVVSPCRGIDYYIKDGIIPSEQESTQRGRDMMNQQNQLRIRSMIKQIKSSGFSYTPVYGGFIEDLGTDSERMVYERSFVIYCKDRNGKQMDFEKLYDFGIKLCREYNQNSILVKYPDNGPENGKLVTVNQREQVDIEFDNKATFNDVSKEYFTDLHKYNTPRDNSKPTRITFDIVECQDVFLNPGPDSYSEGMIRHHNGERFITINGFI